MKSSFQTCILYWLRLTLSKITISYQRRECDSSSTIGQFDIIHIVLAVTNEHKMAKLTCSYVLLFYSALALKGLQSSKPHSPIHAHYFQWKHHKQLILPKDSLAFRMESARDQTTNLNLTQLVDNMLYFVSHSHSDFL